jgi:hypothetical protein
METLASCSPKFRTTVRRKENTVLILVGIATAAALAGTLHAVRQTLARLPRSNRDWVFY